MADSPAAIKTAVMAHLGGKSCVEINNLEPLIFFFFFSKSGMFFCQSVSRVSYLIGCLSLVMTV